MSFNHDNNVEDIPSDDNYDDDEMERRRYASDDGTHDVDDIKSSKKESYIILKEDDLNKKVLVLNNFETSKIRMGQMLYKVVEIAYGKLIEDLQIISEELSEYINSPCWNRPTFYDDDDEYSIQYKEHLENSYNAIAPVLPTEEPDNSLSMGNEHLSTIPKMKSNEVIKSSVKNLVPIPSESDVTSENENTLIDSSAKIDFLLEEFSGELAHIDPIPLGIEEAEFDLEEEIRLVENLLYDNLSPRPLEELNAKIADTIVESLSPSPIPVEDSDSQMGEIDLFLDTGDLMPPGIENNDYESEGDIHFLDELLSNDSFPLPENESSIFDHHDDPSFSRPPPEPPDVLFDFKPDTGVLIVKVVEDISEHHVLMPKVLPSQPTICPNIDILLPFSSENEDKVFKPGILSYLLISHRDKSAR
nr:hypothetical protein [Tanacetum cinerariifolium]